MLLKNVFYTTLNHTSILNKNNLNTMQTQCINKVVVMFKIFARYVLVTCCQTALVMLMFIVLYLLLVICSVYPADVLVDPLYYKGCWQSRFFTKRIPSILVDYTKGKQQDLLLITFNEPEGSSAQSKGTL